MSVRALAPPVIIDIAQDLVLKSSNSFFLDGYSLPLPAGYPLQIQLKNDANNNVIGTRRPRGRALPQIFHHWVS